MAFTIVKPVLKDIEAYPILTEEVGLAPSPVSKSGVAVPGVPAPGSIGQVASKAIADVLGWKIKDGDAKAFVGALTQSFTLTDVEGHVESKWTPRTYAVQTDLSGGITGAQASLYSRAKDALEESLPLLDGLYPLDTEADPEDITALKSVARSQLTELVAELGLLGGPRVSRVNQYFALLIGDSYPADPTPDSKVFPTDPDSVGGTLGDLRDTLGLNFRNQDFVNTVADEQDLSNFRILSDYVTSLAQSWINNLAFFGLDSKSPFFGTQLVLISRQLSVVGELVDEVRFTLDSVFIGPAERQTLQLNFTNGEPPMFAEDLYNWIQAFATDEGPRLIQDGGKFAVENTFVPVANQLLELVTASRNVAHVPRGYHTSRVQRALQQLQSELLELVNLAEPIKHTISIEPEPGLTFEVTSVDPNVIYIDKNPNDAPPRLRILGSGFMSPTAAVKIQNQEFDLPVNFYFRSEGCVIADITDPAPGTFSVSVTNPDGKLKTKDKALTIRPGPPPHRFERSRTRPAPGATSKP
jgi:hypothetical protein